MGYTNLAYFQTIFKTMTDRAVLYTDDVREFSWDNVVRVPCPCPRLVKCPSLLIVMRTCPPNLEMIRDIFRVPDNFFLWSFFLKRGGFYGLQYGNTRHKESFFFISVVLKPNIIVIRIYNRQCLQLFSNT